MSTGVRECTPVYGFSTSGVLFQVRCPPPYGREAASEDARLAPWTDRRGWPNGRDRDDDSEPMRAGRRLPGAALPAALSPDKTAQQIAHAHDDGAEDG